MWRLALLCLLLVPMLAVSAPADSAPAAATPRASAPAGANPLPALDRAVDRTPRDGFIAELVAAGPYTYALVGLGEGDEYEERWVVAMRRGLEAGDVVRVTPMGLQRDYVSKRTGRTFDALWFATVVLLD